MKIKKHYAWLVCFACTMLFFCGIGFSTTAISVYFPFMKEHMNLTNTQVSMISTARTLSSTVSMLLANALYKRISLRQGTALSMACLVVARIVFAFAPNVWFYYLAAAFMGITYSWGVMFPVMIYLNNWFQDRYATAAGIATCGSGICTIIMPPVVTYFIGRVGIRATFLGEAVFIAALTILLVAILRDKPEDLRLERYTEEGAGEKKKAVAKEMKDYPSQPELLLVVFAAFLIGIVAAPSTANYAIHYTTQGYTSAIVATAMSAYGMSNFVGKLTIGAASDKAKTFYVNFAFVGLWVVASAATALVNGTFAMLMAATLLNGIGTPMATLGIASWSRDLARPEDYRKVFSKNQSLFTIGSLIGAPLPGIIADQVGSYRPVYLLFAALLLASLVILEIVYARHTDWGARRAPTQQEEG